MEADLKCFAVPLMLKVEALAFSGSIRNFWREHAMLHEPEAHVVIFPPPPPEVHPIPIHRLELLASKDTDATKEVL